MTNINAFKNDGENCDRNLNSTKARMNGKENSDEYDYVMILKNTFDRSLLPNNFDKWTISKQYIWINKNLSKLYPNVPKSLLELIPASFCQGDYSRSLVEKPEWLDMDKYRRGQKFVENYFVGVIIVMVIGLFHLYSFEDTLKPFILSERAHTPYLAYKRYLSTVRRMANIFRGEPWIKGTPAYKEMESIRRLHYMMQVKLSSLSKDKIDAACTFANPWCSDRELLLKDFAALCPFEKIGQRPYKLFTKLPYKQKYLNTADMAVAQGCFIGLILLHPQEYGVHNATDEDLEAFCHIWRCYGYFLGMKDEYNFCRGSFEEIKQRIRDLYQYWIIPNFKDITPEWEHMTKCVTEPFNYFPWMYMSYKSGLLLAINMFNVNMSHIYKSFTFLDWIIYNSLKFMLHYASKFSSIRLLFNQVFRRSLKQARFKEEQIHQLSKKQISDFRVMYD